MVVAVAQVSANGAIVINSGFETPIVPGCFGTAYTAPYGGYTLDPKFIPGWVMGPSQGGAPDGAYQGIWNAAESPNQFGGTTTGFEGSQVGMFAVKGGFYQDIAGFVAAPHTVSFLAAGRIDVTQPDEFKVTVDGASLTFSGAATITPASQSFVLYTSDPFTPTAGTHRLAFTGLTGADATSFVDNVSVNQVPEPTGVVLMFAGVFGVLCYAWRNGIWTIS